MPRLTGTPPTRITLHDLDSRLLRYLLAVVRAGSIRGAAETQNVAASAISRQISDLEARLGLKLLERLPRGVVPTEAGRAIAEHARQQMQDGEQLIDFLKQLHGLRQGAVRIACGEGFVGDLVENGIRPFLAEHPQAGLHITLGGTEEILLAVGEGRADIGLAYDPPADPSLRSLAVSRQPLCLLAAPGWLAATGRPAWPAGEIALRDVASHPAALLTPSHGIRQLLSRVEAEGGFHLTVQAEAGSIDVVRRLAVAGSLVTFLPVFAAAAEVSAGQLLAAPLADAPLSGASAHLVVRARRRLPAAVAAMVSRLTTSMRAFIEPMSPPGQG